MQPRAAGGRSSNNIISVRRVGADSPLDTRTPKVELSRGTMQSTKPSNSDFWRSFNMENPTRPSGISSIRQKPRGLLCWRSASLGSASRAHEDSDRQRLTGRHWWRGNGRPEGSAPRVRRPARVEAGAWPFPDRAVSRFALGGEPGTCFSEFLGPSFGVHGPERSSRRVTATTPTARSRLLGVAGNTPPYGFGALTGHFVETA